MVSAKFVRPTLIWQENLMDLWPADSHLLVDGWQEQGFIFLEVSITYFHSYKPIIPEEVMAERERRRLSAEGCVSISEGSS